MNSQAGNGSERLDPHGGRRMTVQGVGLVEIVQHERLREDGTLELGTTVVTLEPLDEQQTERLRLWLEHEWPKRTN